MLSKENFAPNNRFNKVFSIAKDFSQRQAYINSLDRPKTLIKTAEGGKRSAKYIVVEPDKLTKKQIERKMKNRLSAIKSRSNVKRTIWSLEINNRELKQENHDLREALKVAKGPNTHNDTSILNEVESTDNDSSSMDSSTKSFYSCRQCGFKNYVQPKQSLGLVQYSNLNNLDNETINNFNSNIWFLNHKDLEPEMKSQNLVKEVQQEKLIIASSSASSSSGLNLFRYGLSIAVLCILAVFFSIGVKQSGKIIESKVASPSRILQEITEIISPKQPNNELLKLLPNRDAEQSPATQIQRYISEEELENKIILKEKRDKFIKQVSKGKSKESCVIKPKNTSSNSKLVVPYKLGNKRLIEEQSQLATIQETMTRSIGSIMLTDQTLIDDASILSFQNIETHYSSNSDDDSGCFFLHMIIPNQIFEINNYDFGSSAKNAFWEVGCKIFQFKRIDK